MALNYLNRSVWRAVSTGTGDFVVSSAITGFLVPEDCTNPSVVNNGTYRYFAESEDKTEWEVGYGVYTTGDNTLTRDTILDSSNGGAATSFAAAPKVFMGGPLAQDIGWRVIADETLGSPATTFSIAVDLTEYQLIRIEGRGIESENSVEITCNLYDSGPAFLVDLFRISSISLGAGDTVKFQTAEIPIYEDGAASMERDQNNEGWGCFITSNGTKDGLTPAGTTVSWAGTVAALVFSSNDGVDDINITDARVIVYGFKRAD